MATKNKKRLERELKLDKLDLSTGVQAMAITDDPAIEKLGVMMKKEKEDEQ